MKNAIKNIFEALSNPNVPNYVKTAILELHQHLSDHAHLYRLELVAMETKTLYNCMEWMENMDGGERCC